MEKEQLIAFVEVNHHLMTLSEMAEETGNNIPLIKRICDNNGWQPMTIPERMKEFIESNKHLSLEEQAEKVGLGITGLKHHYKALGIPLPEKKKQPQDIIIEPQEDKRKVKIKFKENIDRRSFTYYNQSGTDFLDSFNGIKITDRNDRLLM